MDVPRFGLGLRFDLLDAAITGNAGKRLFEEIFSVLTVNDTHGMHVYGGKSTAEADADKNIYLVVFTGAGLPRMKRMYAKLNADAGIAMYLDATKPYIQTNALTNIEAPTYYGVVKKNGMLEGGDADLGIIIPHKRGKRRAAGKGVKIVLAPDAYEDALTSLDAIKRLTLAARRHLLGVKIAPIPLNCSGPGALETLVTVCGGLYRNAKIVAPQGSETALMRYGVINGNTAVLDICDLGAESSASLGNMIHRILDEGIHNILFTNAAARYTDGGQGCLTALGMTLQEGDKAILTGMHPRLETLCITAISDPSCLSDEMQHVLQALVPFIAGLHFASPADAFLDAAKFESFLKRGAALVVSGEGRLDANKAQPSKAVATVIRRAAKMKVPVAVIAGNVDTENSTLYNSSNAGIMTLIAQPENEKQDREAMLRRFDDAADRMFRFIRLGRDVNKKERKRPERY